MMNAIISPLRGGVTPRPDKDSSVSWISLDIISKAEVRHRRVSGLFITRILLGLMERASDSQ